MKWNFPPWTNKLRTLTGAAVVGGLLYVTVILNFGFSPDAVAVGYRPEQPVPFSHALHAGELGMDCRYCHQTVEKAAHAAIPSTQTCMGCHERIHDESKKLAPVRASWATNEPVEWIRIHDLPDYAYFNHAAHVQKGVGCTSCHGRIDKMEVVYQKHKLSMGWCLECHRNPEPHLRPKHLVTKMDWEPGKSNAGPGEATLMSAAQTGAAAGDAAKNAIADVNPPQMCGACHR